MDTLTDTPLEPDDEERAASEGATAPREDLIRQVSFELVRSGDDGLTLEGYAAVFNSPALIDSWEGRFTETIARGAFKKTLAESTPVLMFNHGKHPLIGDIPLGVIRSIKEDAKGVYVKARLSDNWLIAPVRDAIRDGAVTGMSFRFSVVQDKWTGRGDTLARNVTELRSRELGPVVFPAYIETSVAVRSMAPDLRRELLRELSDTSNPAGTSTGPEAVHPEEPAVRHSEVTGTDPKAVLALTAALRR